MESSTSLDEIVNQYQTLSQKVEKYESENKEVISEYNKQIDLAALNVHNGEFGRMHAQSSLEQAKALAHKVQENIETETKDLQTLITKPDETGTINLKKSEARLANFIGEATAIHDKFSELEELEQTLDILHDGEKDTDIQKI